jgi:glycosyltransferase involved in cell wall biosynthesis
MKDSSHYKVLILTNSVSGGGAEISMMNLYESLKKSGIDVNLCAINTDESRTLIDDKIVVLGRPWKAGLVETAKNLNKFRKLISQGNFTIIVANCELPELYLAFAAPRKVKHVAVEHTSRPWLGRRLLGIFIRSLLSVRKTSWVTVSTNQKSVWPFGNKPVLIRNAYLPPENEAEVSGSTLLFVGRLNSNKHPEIAAKVANDLGVSIDFYGDGPMIGSLRGEYQSEKCRFLGFVPNPWNVISKNSILVVPSEFEGDGMNVVEAALNGNPMLLADNYDLRRFNFPDHLYFKGVDSLKTKIQDAQKAGVDKYRLESKARANLGSERSITSITRQWADLFTQIDS